MTVDEVYKLMQFIINKNQQGYLKPADFNTSINTAQKSYLDYLLGEYQKYQIKRPISVVEFGQNQRIRQSISPLIYGTVLSPFVYNGIAPFPSDYEYNDAMWTLYGLYKIRFVQQDRLDDYYHSTIDPIVSNPIYLINHEGFQFYPENIGAAKMSYVRTPPTIKWAYIEINGRPVYDPLNSIDPVWADTDLLNIIVRALQMVGTNLQLGTVVQYSQEIKNGGQ